MKKYIISVLIPSLLIYLTGCYSMQEVTKEEFSPKPDYPNLKILTEERELTFKEGDYIFQNDSIIGLGKSVLLVSNWQPFDGKINNNDFEKSETIKMSDSLDTTNVFLKTKEKE